MGLFTGLKLGILDKRIVQHYESHGNVSNETGHTLICKFVAQALKKGSVRQIISRYGFNEADLVFLYCSMADALLPNPTIHTGPDAPHLSRMMAPSLPFYEPARLDEILRIARECVEDNALPALGFLKDDSAKRKLAIREVGKETAYLIRDIHWENFGEPEFMSTDNAHNA